MSTVAGITNTGTNPAVTNEFAGRAARTAPTGGTTTDTGSTATDRAATSTRAVDADLLQRSVATVEEHVQVAERRINFEVDDSTGQTVVRVIDPESGDLIRQIPPEVVVAAAAALSELADTGGAASALRGLLLEAEA